MDWKPFCKKIKMKINMSMQSKSSQMIKSKFISTWSNVSHQKNERIYWILADKSPNLQSEENNSSNKIKSQSLMCIQTLDLKISSFLEIRKSKRLNKDLMVIWLSLSLNTPKKTKLKISLINITSLFKITLTLSTYKMISEIERILSLLLSSTKKWLIKSFHWKKSISKSLLS